MEASAEVAGYSDTDHVWVVTPTTRVGARDTDRGWSLGARYLADIVSAASVDIVSTASRRWTEVRHVVSVEGQYRPDDLGVSANGSVSIEPDYVSLAAGLGATLALDDDHVALSGRYAVGHDTIGRTGTPFAVFSHELWKHAFTLGSTLVLDRSNTLAFGADAVLERGDQSKPYRYVPLFSPNDARRIPRGASVELVNSLRLPERPLERLPLERNRFAGTARWLRRSDTTTLRLEERGYRDDWGLTATTTDATLGIDLDERWTLGPTLRFHLQTGTDFWKRGYEPDASGGPPAIRTGDRELGPLWTLTLGGRLALAIDAPSAFSSDSIVFQLSGMHTEFLDALFIQRRDAVLGAILFRSEW